MAETTTVVEILATRWQGYGRPEWQWWLEMAWQIIYRQEWQVAVNGMAEIGQKGGNGGSASSFGSRASGNGTQWLLWQWHREWQRKARVIWQR
jgi:hypothetical protein